MILKGFLNPTNSFIRFLLVGIVNTAVGLTTTFVMLHNAKLPYWWATFIGNSLGACVSYVLNRTYTFRSTTSSAKSFPRFIAVILSCYCLAYSLSRMMASFLAGVLPAAFEDVWEDTAILLGAIFYTLLNYLAQKVIVFPSK